MVDKISSLLTNLEKENSEIEIVLAVEAGSRAWGFNSDESDFDVRFVYRYRDPRKYITTRKHSDTITGSTEEGKYDYQGWELRKAITLLRQSNSGMLEWLHTPIIYLEKYNIKSKFFEILKKMHTNRSLTYHYYNMAKRNYKDRIESNQIVTLKKYTYVLRPVGMVDWLMRFPKKEITIDFNLILKDLASHIPSDELMTIQKFFQDRREGKLPIEGPHLELLDKYILSVFEAFDKNHQKPQLEINQQGTASLYQKITNCYSTIRAILRKNEHISRSEYLNIIGFMLQFKWLKAHPDQNMKDIPAQIHNLVDHVELDQEIADFIKMISGRESDAYFQKRVDDDDRMISTDVWIQIIFRGFLGPVMDSLRFINAWVQSKKKISVEEFEENDFSEALLKMLNPNPDNSLVNVEFQNFKLPEMTTFPRDDIIDYILSQWIPSILWLLENPNSTYSRIPKQPLNELKISAQMKESIQDLIRESKVTYLMDQVDELHQWIEKFIKEEDEYVKKVIETNLKLKEERTKEAYNQSIEDLDDSVFDKFLHEMTIDFAT